MYLILPPVLAGLVAGIVLYRLKIAPWMTYPSMWVIFLVSFAAFAGSPVGLFASIGGLGILLITGMLYVGCSLWMRTSQ